MEKRVEIKQNTVDGLRVEICEAILNLHVGGGRSYNGRVVTIDEQGRQLTERRCNETEFHVHVKAEAAVKCMQKQLAKKGGAR